MSTHHDAALVCDALQAAVVTRGLKRMPDTISTPTAAPNTPRLPASMPAGGWGFAVL